MNTESIYKSIAEEIFSDSIDSADDTGAALHFFYRLIQEQSAGRINFEQANFFVVRHNDDMDKITKLAALLPERVTITNVNKTITQLDKHIYIDEYGKIGQWERYAFLPSGDFRKWLRGALPLFENNILSYYPNTIDYYLDSKKNESTVKDYTIDVTDICACCGQILNHDFHLSKVAELNIPYLYDVPLSDFGKITVDNIGALKNFQLFFGKNIVNLDFDNRRIAYEFQYELSNQLNRIETMYKKECAKLASSIAIGTIATVSASLYQIYDVNELYSVVFGIMGMAGVLPLIKSVIGYNIEKITIKGEDCYFLWLLHKKHLI